MSAGPLDEPGALLDRIARGDRDAFARFYDRYAALVYTSASRMLRGRPETDDLLQEVFFQAWRQAGNYRPERGSPEAWLLTITRSRCIDKLRSMRRRKASEVPGDVPGAAGGGGSVESGASEAEARLTARGALADLPEAQRRVLELAYFDGLTQVEIATRLGEPLGTVKTRMRAGLERLRGWMQARGVGGAR